MSVKDHVPNFATPDRPILVSLDSKQLAALRGLDDHVYLIQEERLLHEGFNLSMGFCAHPAGIKSIKDQKQAQTMFRGDAVKMFYCCPKKDFQSAQANVLALLKLLPNWTTVDFVLLDPISPDLYEEGGRMAKELLINAESIWKGERNLINQGMETAWVPWVIRVTHSCAQSTKPAELCVLPLFATRGGPKRRLFV